MQAMIEISEEKKTLFQAEAQNKIMHEKNKTLMAEVISLRNEVDRKDYELQKAETKASQTEKKLVLVQRQV
jgi:hypothetical protein